MLRGNSRLKASLIRRLLAGPCVSSVEFDSKPSSIKSQVSPVWRKATVRSFLNVLRDISLSVLSAGALKSFACACLMGMSFIL